MTDPYGTSGRGDDDPTPTDPPDREPEIVEGEVVDDATADAFGGRRSGTGGFIGQSPFAEPDPFGVPGSAPQFGVGGVGASFAALRSLAGNSPELREMVTTPLRLLAIVVAVPALIAALFGLTIDSGARYLAFVIGALGLVAAVLLELRRRRLAAVPPPQRAGDPPRRGAGKLIGLVAGGLLITMLAIGFDLLALILVIFGVW